jgi:phosphotransferase system IIB component
MYTRNRLDKIKEKKNIINVEHIRKKRLSFYMKTKQKSNDIYLKNKLES